MTHAVTIESATHIEIISRHASQADARAEAQELRASYGHALPKGHRIRVRLRKQ